MPASLVSYRDPLPTRVRALVIGGGIHGVGVLHDLVSRGWRDIHLVEKTILGWGTSSRSTKLVHGGLRYLQSMRDWPLVQEALRERQTLLNLAPDLVKPLELFFPIMKKGGMPGFMVRAGLTLYDILAGRHGIHRHRRVALDELALKAPIADSGKFRKMYSFWDGQMDDLTLAHRVAASAHAQGARITEEAEVVSIQPTEDGWLVAIKSQDGSIQKISALYLINAAGPWSGQLLEKSGIRATHAAVNNKGAHLVFPSMGLTAGLFLQSPTDHRIFFVLPWNGQTLVGTTEDEYNDNPNDVSCSSNDVRYLLERCNMYLREPLKEKNIITSFAGLRWLAKDEGRGLSGMSRHYVLGEHTSTRGLMITIYGGKWTTYRSLSEMIGDRLLTHFGEQRISRTTEPSMWLKSHVSPWTQLSVRDRFDALNGLAGQQPVSGTARGFG